MTIERIPGYEDIIEIINCKDYNFSVRHKSNLKKLANFIKEYNPKKGACLIECSKEELITIIKTLNR